jgi:hypothetical protein
MNPNHFSFYSALCALFAVITLTRAVMNWRARCRERRRLMTIAQRGERRFCGTDWTLPQWERHETLNTKRRIRTTHGGVVIDCLGLVICSYALLAVLWLFATGVFAL